jgi:methyl-accepting chemotaxis protein
MSMATMDGLTALRRAASRLVLGLLWAAVPLTLGLALSLGVPVLFPTAVATISAAVATAVVWRDPDAAATRAVVAISAVLVPAVMVAELAGHPWQIDMHMAFFAVLAVLAVYADWRVILVATVVIALHHLSLNFILPALVFPGGADLGRVVLHAVIVLMEAGALIWVTRRVEAVLPAAERAASEAAAQAEAVRRLTAEREAEVRRAEAEKREATRSLADGFEAEMGGATAEVSETARSMNGTAETLPTPRTSRARRPRRRPTRLSARPGRCRRPLPPSRRCPPRSPRSPAAWPMPPPSRAMPRARQRRWRRPSPISARRVGASAPSPT